MHRSRITRTLAAGAAVTLLAATPALAAPIDNVQFDTAKVDFGNSWSGGAPTAPAELDWSNANGATCLTGNLYMTQANGISARVELEIYDDASHAAGDPPLATTRSQIKTAVGAGLNVFSLSPACINSSGTHAHVKLLDDSSNPGGGLVVRSTAFLNE
jgi:hypothetical protein